MGSRDRVDVQLTDGGTIILDDKTPGGTYDLFDGRRLEVEPATGYPRSYSVCQEAGSEVAFSISDIAHPLLVIQSASASQPTTDEIERMLMDREQDTGSLPTAIHLPSGWQGEYVMPTPLDTGVPFSLLLYDIPPTQTALATSDCRTRDRQAPSQTAASVPHRFSAELRRWLEVNPATGMITERYWAIAGK